VCCGLLLLMGALVLPESLLLLLEAGCGWYNDAHVITIRLQGLRQAGQRRAKG
jgi:hypothetical protein